MNAPLNEKEMAMPSPRKVLTFVIIFAVVAAIYAALVVWGHGVSKTSAVNEDAWWTDRQAGMIGAIVGVTVGLFGALVGMLGGLGLARRFVLGMMIVGSVAGFVLLIAGIVAFVMKQPYGVWYALLHPGFLMSILFTVLYPVAKRGYAMRELRKMQAMDAQG